MALVRRIDHASKERQEPQRPTVCLASVFSDAEGNSYIQLDTYGSNSRKIPGKMSQSIQFDAASAAQLKLLIETAFSPRKDTPNEV